MNALFRKAAACLIFASLTKVAARGVSGWIPVRSASCEYPILGLQARISGVVRLRIAVNVEGEVVKVSAISGNPVLVSAARRNLMTWRFACVSDEAGSNCGSNALRVFDFVYSFRLLDTEDLANHTPLFVYEYPNKATVSAVAPHLEP
jgi:hypothetical protein